MYNYLPFYGSNFRTGQDWNTKYTFYSLFLWFMLFLGFQFKIRWGPTNEACFMTENLIMHWISRSIKSMFGFFFSSDRFFMSATPRWFFFLFLVWFTPAPERETRQFFYDHGMVLAPIFGAFLCDSTQHAACWFSLVFQPPGLLAEAVSWLRQTNVSCSKNREILKAWSRKFWCLFSLMDFSVEGMCNQEDFGV